LPVATVCFGARAIAASAFAARLLRQIHLAKERFEARIRC